MKMKLVVYKSIDAKDEHWLIWECDDTTQIHHIGKLPIGNTLLFWINLAIRTADCGYVRILVNDDLTDTLLQPYILDNKKLTEFKKGIRGVEFLELPHNKEELTEYCQEFLDILTQKDDYTKSVDGRNRLMEEYEKFKWFACNFSNGNPLCQNHRLCDLIEFGGYRFRDGVRYEAFSVPDFHVLFNLDLYAYLFSTNRYSSKIVQCDYCKSYFFAPNGRYRYCPDCKSNKEIMNAIAQSNIKDDPLQVVKRKVWSKLDYNFTDDILDLERAIFNERMDYYKKRWEGKLKDVDRDANYDKDLPQIESVQDIVDWALQWCDEEISKYSGRRE